MVVKKTRRHPPLCSLLQDSTYTITMRATQQQQATHLFVLMAGSALLASSSSLFLILIIVPLCSIIRTDDVDESSRRLSIFNIPSQYDDPKSIADKIILPGEATPTYIDLINSASPLPKYSLDKVVALSKIYSSRFSILRYDPGTDRFVGYYSSEHKWVSGCTKLAEAFRILTILLRNLFPEVSGRDSCIYHRFFTLASIIASFRFHLSINFFHLSRDLHQIHPSWY